MFGLKSCMTMEINEMEIRNALNMKEFINLCKVCKFNCKQGDRCNVKEAGERGK